MGTELSGAVLEPYSVPDPGQPFAFEVDVLQLSQCMRHESKILHLCEEQHPKYAFFSEDATKAASLAQR